MSDIKERAKEFIAENKDYKKFLEAATLRGITESQIVKFTNQEREMLLDELIKKSQILSGELCHQKRTIFLNDLLKILESYKSNKDE